LITVEFHCHTIASIDSLTQPADLLAAYRRKGIDRVAVTDHNTTAGARQAQALEPDRVIIGEEIKTSRGELLAFFVKEEIPRGLDPLATIARLREQDAFISVSHPFDRERSGAWELSDLTQIAPLVDAIEIFNARCLSARYNQEAADFARQHHLAGTAGSDGHHVREAGQAILRLPDFHDAESLRAVICQGEVVGKLSPWWVHLYSAYARWYKTTHKQPFAPAPSKRR